MTLQYAAGYEQQIGKNSSVDVQYIYKDVKDLVGWNITGGAYEPFLFTDPFTGKQYTLLNIREHPLLQKGNDPGDFPGSERFRWFQKYHGLILSYNRRFSDKFALNASYTWSTSYGLLPRPLSQVQRAPFFGSREGSYPNQYVNAEGPLQGDSPQMFRVQTIFSRLPWDIEFSACLDISSGRAFTRQIRVRGMNQGGVTLIMEHTTALRYSGVRIVDVSFARRFAAGNRFRIRLTGAIFNLLNSDQELFFGTLILQKPSDTFTPNAWVRPRLLQIGLGLEF